MEKLAEHEALQMSVLQWLRSKRILNTLAFGEAAMLRFCHELPRYSPDMYFWFFKAGDIATFYTSLLQEFLGQYYVVTAEDNSSSLLFELKKGKDGPQVKLEIHKTVSPPGTCEEKIAFSSHYPMQVLVRGLTLKQVLKSKVSALIENGNIRDAFDLDFLVRKGIPLDLPEQKRKIFILRLKSFNSLDFDTQLGDLLLPEAKDMYLEQGFKHLEEKLS
jgi:hypothetical protein